MSSGASLVETKPVLRLAKTKKTTDPKAPDTTLEQLTSSQFSDTQNTLRRIEYSGAKNGKRCFWCFRDVDKDPVGVPTARRYSDQVYICEGTFCGHNRYACAYAWLLREQGMIPSRSDIIYKNALPYLKHLYLQIYPDAESRPMVPAPDYRLLSLNGGTLSSEQFDQYMGGTGIVSDRKKTLPAYAIERTPFTHTPSQAKIRSGSVAGNVFHVSTAPRVQ